MPAPYVAYLRVYDPLIAFPDPERRHWQRYVVEGAAPTRTLGPRQEGAAALRELLGGAAGDPGDEGAFVAELDGTAVVCPWRTALRSWETVLAVRDGMAELVADAFVPPAVAEAVRTRSEQVQAANPSARTHIRASTWSVPVHWFVPFDERSRQAGPDPDGTVSVVYRASMADARRRCARALSVLRKSEQDSGQAEFFVEDLARWLEEFHPHGLVELDYGGLASLLAPDELAADRSAADVSAALAALARGDQAAVEAAYTRVAERWRRTQLAENNN